MGVKRTAAGPVWKRGTLQGAPVVRRRDSGSQWGSGGYLAPRSPDLLKDAFWVVLGLHYCTGFSPVAEKRPALVWRAGSSLRWLLLWGMGSGHAGFSNCSSQAPEHSLSTCGSWAELLHSIWNIPQSGDQTRVSCISRHILYR